MAIILIVGIILGMWINKHFKVKITRRRDEEN